MTKFYTGDLVGSEDVTKVFHFSGGFHTVRRSAEYAPFFPHWGIMASSPIVSLFDSLVEPQAGLDVELTECDLGAGLTTRHFKKVSMACGRKFPGVVHYFLSDEVK